MARGHLKTRDNTSRSLGERCALASIILIEDTFASVYA